MSTLCIIDGNSSIHRAYHALPKLNTSRGQPVNAVYGFIKMVLKIIKEVRPEYLVVCFDTPEDTFRHKIYPSYKANRTEMDDDLASQFPIIKRVVDTWGLATLAKPGYEADDLIASMAKSFEKEGQKVVIVTGDKDAYQLVNSHTTVYNDAKGIYYDPPKVQERYGISPDRLIDFFSLTGDSIDNVQGIPGVGEKTATKLLQEYGSLSKIVENAAQLKPAIRDAILTNKDRLALNRQLIRLEDSIDLGLPIERCRPQTPDKEKWLTLLRELEFSSLLKEFVPARKPLEEMHEKTELITTEAALAQLDQDLQGIPHLSLDVETDGLDPHQCTLVGLALAFNDRSFYIPLAHSYIGVPEQLPKEKVLGVLKKHLENPKLPKWGQNLKFDVHVLKASGVNVQDLAFDSLIAAYCLNPSRLTYNLKDMAFDLLGKQMFRFEEVAVQKGKFGLQEVELKLAAHYSGDDVDAVLKLGALFLPQIKEKNLGALFFDVEMPLLSVLINMESAGIKVDPERLKQLGNEFNKEKSLLEEEICKLTGTRFNLNSPKQLAEVLFEKLKLPVIRRTKTGYSTDEEVLTQLKNLHPACEKIIQYRELSKLKSTYTDALLAIMNPKTGRVHTSFNQSGTATGRLSSSNPNLQNIPIRTEYGRKIRRAFLPDSNFFFASADYSQIDLRVLAHLSQDAALSKAFHMSADVHVSTAAEVFHVPVESVTPEMRKGAKAINFGIVYGQQAFGLSQQLGISVDEAQNYIQKYFARYHGVKLWIERTIQETRASGVATTLLGRRRPLPEILSKNAPQRNFAERAAVNTPVQGTSADIIKVAMIHINHLLEGKKLRSRTLVQVHDELLFEIDPQETKEILPLIKTTMENSIKLSVPLLVDIKTGDNWADLQPWKPA